jgi:flagellar basal body-associated protein FliL
LAWYDDPLTVILIVVVVVVACGTVVAAMRRYGGSNNKKAEPQPKDKPQPPQMQQRQVDLEYTNMPVPFKISKSVQGTMATSAKDELRMLDLEREILGDAIRRLYEAQAEGKITESERDKLAASYKQRMNTIAFEAAPEPEPDPQPLFEPEPEPELEMEAEESDEDDLDTPAYLRQGKLIQ